MTSLITTPQLMYIGGDALASIGDCLAKLDMRNPLIVTDPFMAQSGKIKALTDQLDEAGLHYRVFSDTVPEPTTDVIDAGVALLAQADFDGLIAFGGGSPIDTAKAINILAAGGGQMRDYKVPAQPNMPVMPLIAIPTTAGTGSEVTKVTVITDTTTSGSKAGEKMLIMGLACLPSAAIVDYT
ncbi:MAG: iron-containing alcohol dehydrogenase, partial [Alphaproteobacteria bacterium]